MNRPRFMAMRQYPPAMQQQRTGPKQAADNNSKPENDTQPAKLAQPAVEVADVQSSANAQRDLPHVGDLGTAHCNDDQNSDLPHVADEGVVCKTKRATNIFGESDEPWESPLGGIDTVGDDEKEGE